VKLKICVLQDSRIIEFCQQSSQIVLEASNMSGVVARNLSSL